MKETQLAHRYALALFTVAREHGLIERVANDFRQLKTVIKENREFRTMLVSPVIPVHKKISVLKALFAAHMDELSIRFMSLLTQNGRDRYLDAVADAVELLYRDFMGIVHVRVTSAMPLSPANRQQLVEQLKELLGNKLELHETIDPSVMGGFVLDWNDQRYDATLLREVKELRKEFQENLYVRQF